MATGTIRDTQLRTISTPGKVALAALEIDGGTALSGTLDAADLFIVDDGAGGDNKKVTAAIMQDFFSAPDVPDAGDSDNTNYKIVLSPGGDAAALKHDTELTYNPSTDLLSAGSITLNRADAAGDVTLSFAQAGTVGYTMGIDDSDSNVWKLHSHTSLQDSSDVSLSAAGVMTLASLVATTADINGGAIDGTVIGATSAAAGTFAALVATSADINGVGDFSDTLTASKSSGTGLSVAANAAVGGDLQVTGAAVINGDVDLGNATSDTITATGRFDSDLVPSTDGARDLGASGLEWKDLYLDGTANIDSLVADTADINGGTADNVVIGGTTAAAGAFTTLTVASDLIHDGDTNNKIAFGTDTQSFETGGTARMNLSDSGLQIGTGARITEVEDNDSLGTSNIKLATQGNIKAYVDANIAGMDLKDSVAAAYTASFTMASTASSSTLVLASGEGGFTAGGTSTIASGFHSSIPSGTTLDNTLAVPFVRFGLGSLPSGVASIQNGDAITVTDSNSSFTATASGAGSLTATFITSLASNLTSRTYGNSDASSIKAIRLSSQFSAGSNIAAIAQSDKVNMSDGTGTFTADVDSAAASNSLPLTGTFLTFGSGQTITASTTSISVSSIPSEVSANVLSGDKLVLVQGGVTAEGTLSATPSGTSYQFSSGFSFSGGSSVSTDSSFSSAGFQGVGIAITSVNFTGSNDVTFDGDPSGKTASVTASGIPLTGGTLSGSAASSDTLSVGKAERTTSSSYSVDGVTISADDRVLVKDGVNSNSAGVHNKWNGVYKVGSLGGSTVTLDRTSDFDAASEFIGAPFFLVDAGTDNGSHGFVCSLASSPTIGSDEITFYQFSAPGQDSVAGTGLSMTGNVLSVDAAQTQITSVGALNAGSITSGFGAIDNGTNGIRTGGLLYLDVDGSAIGGAGTLTMGAGSDAAMYWDGGSLVLDTAAASDIAFEVAGTEVASLDADGLSLAEGDAYQIAGSSVLNATTLGSAVVTSSLTTVGALNSGSITSGFTSIDVGSGTIGTSGAITAGSLVGSASTLALGASGDTDAVTLGAQSVTLASDVALTYKGTAITATGAEINYLDNADLTAADLTKLAAIDASAAEINLLDASAGSTVALAHADAMIIGDASDTNATKKVLLSDLATLLSGAGLTQSGATLSINVVRDSFEQSDATSGNTVCALNFEPVSQDSVDVYLNGVLQIDADEGPSDSDYTYGGSAGSRTITLASAMLSDDIVTVKYIAKSE